MPTVNNPIIIPRILLQHFNFIHIKGNIQFTQYGQCLTVIQIIQHSCKAFNIFFINFCLSDMWVLGKRFFACILGVLKLGS